MSNTIRCPSCKICLAAQPNSLTFSCVCGQLLQCAIAPQSNHGSEAQIVTCPVCTSNLFAPVGNAQFACPCGQVLQAPPKKDNIFECPNCFKMIQSPPGNPALFSCLCGQFFQFEQPSSTLKTIEDRIFESQERTDEARQVFYEYDKDSSGEISLEELQPMLRRLGFEEGVVDREFREADSDHSGTLSFNEFIAYYNTLRNRLQLNSVLSASAEAEAKAEAVKADLLRLEEMRRELEREREAFQQEVKLATSSRPSTATSRPMSSVSSSSRPRSRVSNGSPSRPQSAETVFLGRPDWELSLGQSAVDRIVHEHKKEISDYQFQLQQEKLRQQKALQHKLEMRRQLK